MSNTKIGRPTKYRPEYADKLEEFMSKGKSVFQFVAELRISRSTFYKWVEDHEAFSDAFNRGKDYCEAHWEEQIQAAMWTRDANAQLFKYYFANRFGWRDQPKEEDADKSGEPLNITFAVADPVKSINVTKGEKKQA